MWGDGSNVVYEGKTINPWIFIDLQLEYPGWAGNPDEGEEGVRSYDLAILTVRCPGDTHMEDPASLEFLEV